jgi:hypothetical protein
MPISTIDNCSEAHWSEVREILTESIESAGFDARLVSDADDVGIIQKRIIQNVYDNPLVVCDVSGKNPNVMFELGMRLAFDKPTVIVKDDKTTYSFDTAPIEHLEYPRDLRFSQIVEFKDSLTDKLRATFKKATDDPSYSAFLKHFGSFTVAKLDTKNISTDEYILEEIKALRRLVTRNDASVAAEVNYSSRPTGSSRGTVLCLHGVKISVESIVNALRPFTKGPLRVEQEGRGHYHVTFSDFEGISPVKLLRTCEPFASKARMFPPRREAKQVLFE